MICGISLTFAYEIEKLDETWKRRIRLYICLRTSSLTHIEIGCGPANLDIVKEFGWKHTSTRQTQQQQQ